MATKAEFKPSAKLMKEVFCRKSSQVRLEVRAALAAEPRSQLSEGEGSICMHTSLLHSAHLYWTTCATSSPQEARASQRQTTHKHLRSEPHS